MRFRDYVVKNQTQFSIAMVMLVGIIITVLTFNYGVEMPWFVFFSLIFGAGTFIWYLYVIGVKYYSFLIITENYRTTTFHPKTKIVFDPGFNTHLGLVYGGGYNSPGKYLSWPDVEKGWGGMQKTGEINELFVTMDPFMIEAFGNRRFLVLRGKSYEASRAEAAAFLARPSIKAAIGEEVDSIKRLHVVMRSTSLHPDNISPDVIASMARSPANMDEFGSLLQRWQAEYEMVNEREEERAMRAVTTIERAQTRARPRQPQPTKEPEEKDE